MLNITAEVFHNDILIASNRNHDAYTWGGSLIATLQSSYSVTMQFTLPIPSLPLLYPPNPIFGEILPGEPAEWADDEE